jgi:hypothetical protein
MDFMKMLQIGLPLLGTVMQAGSQARAETSAGQSQSLRDEQMKLALEQARANVPYQNYLREATGKRALQGPDFKRTWVGQNYGA